MLKVALTGGMACGKSTVGTILRRRGWADVCEADVLAHALMLPGQPVHGEVVRLFGPGVLDANGTINRPRLGARVFADPDELARLNAIVHPRVRALWEGWLRERALQQACDMAVVVVPLLFEADMQAGWDAIVCVRAPAAVQQERLRARGLTPEQIAQRLAAQWPVDEKARRADITIENDGTEAELERRTQLVVSRLRESKHG